MTHQPAGITRWERSTVQHVNENISGSKNQSARPGSLHPQQDHLAAGEEAPASQMHHHQKHNHHNTDNNQTSHDGHGIQHQQNQSQHQGTFASTQSDQKKLGQAHLIGGPLKRSQKHLKQKKQPDDEDEDENSEADSDVLDPDLNVYDNAQYN